MQQTANCGRTLGIRSQAMGGLMACTSVALRKRDCPLIGCAWACKPEGGANTAGVESTEWQMPHAAQGALWWLPPQAGALSVVVAQCVLPWSVPVSCNAPPGSAACDAWCAACAGISSATVVAPGWWGSTLGMLPMAMASPSRPRRVSNNIMNRGKKRRIGRNDARVVPKFHADGFRASTRLIHHSDRGGGSWTALG